MTCASISIVAAVYAREVSSFDRGWKFARGDQPTADAVAYDDASWRALDLPHDWSIEDLPPREAIAPEVLAIPGRWSFHRGDNAAWKARDFDDRDWEQVTLPDSWEHHSNYTEDNVYGWFRRRIELPPECKGRDFELVLGQIDDVDEVWLNGERIGGTGSFPPNLKPMWTAQRRYRVPAALVRGDGSDVLAVRVFDAKGNGGIVSAGVKSERVGPFDSKESEGGNATGYVVGGIGWYRKHFTVDAGNRRVAVRFDGVYMNADFWINGHHLGQHPYGYTTFEFDLTPHLQPPGRENLLAVRVNNDGKNSRWYSGSGIYRHVWLTVAEPLHVPEGGVFITTPEVSEDEALVKATIEVRNDTPTETEALVRVRLRDPAGKVSGQSEGTLHVTAGETRSAERYVVVKKPLRWSPTAPQLYTAEVEVLSGGKSSDVVSTHFGIRKIEVDAERGFRVNGEALELKGACVHHDNGPLGAAAIDRAEERRVELLKANGFDAIRTSHNPPSPAFLDACDRLGMLVIDESFDQWNEQKNPEDYHRFFNAWCERDIASMVRRDRNHPSVVIWSIGNEIPEQFRAEKTAQRLREAVLAHDTTRPITAAICSDWGEVARNWDKLSDPAFVHLDIGGYNYLPQHYESDHARHPLRVMMGTESYPKDTYEYWSLVEKHAYIIGDFVWTGMDYLGEAGIGHTALSNEANPFFKSWPWFNAWCGDLDLCGFKKPQSYYRDVVWGRSSLEMMVHTPIAPGLTEEVSGWGWPKETQSWNWSGQEGKPLKVSVYSRCERVRLELNGKVIDEKPVSGATKLTATFDVPYAPGELRAVGLVGGKVVAQTRLKTTGPAARVKLTVDRKEIRADRNDLAYVAVEVVDADGQRVPNAEIPVHFSVSGAGELGAQASAAPDQMASFHAPVRKTFEGRCIAILRPLDSPGVIELQATAEGLKAAEIEVTSR